jgi:hypothetical protein
MFDHAFLAASKIDRPVAFYEKSLAPLAITHLGDFAADGPDGHPNLKGLF